MRQSRCFCSWINTFFQLRLQITKSNQRPPLMAMCASGLYTLAHTHTQECPIKKITWLCVHPQRSFNLTACWATSCSANQWRVFSLQGGPYGDITAATHHNMAVCRQHRALCRHIWLHAGGPRLTGLECFKWWWSGVKQPTGGSPKVMPRIALDVLSRVVGLVLYEHYQSQSHRASQTDYCNVVLIDWLHFEGSVTRHFSLLSDLMICNSFLC